MTIDKFGRSLRSQDKNLLKGPKGDGFDLTLDGNYDLKHKRICNAAPPLNTNDATTKGYVDFKCIPFSSEKYDLNNKRLSNVGEPLDSTDAVNLKTLNKRVNHCLASNNGSFNAKKRRITNLDNGTEPDDAVTVQQINDLKAQTLLLSGDSFNCNNRQIKSCGDPTDFLDVINMNYVVRLLSEVLYDIYKQLGYINIEKTLWIKEHVIEKYFISDDKRQFRTETEEEEEELDLSSLEGTSVLTPLPPPH